ncbi:unnamed protein product [Diabrotica balteata]|uniref:Uncharacterized protein n=1 Tax=Diabrotica balteata TaxID=107213 RepID=A0A9N9X7V5_DIABA|nr:unnamed protein product [Diabrotica balteata]
MVQKNDGNFRALLWFRINAGDNDLLKHLETAPANATIIGTTVSLSRLLQSPKLDLKKTTEAIEDIKCIFLNKRLNAESVFSKLYYEVKEIAEQLDIELKMPHIVFRQNQPANSCEEYFQRSIYLPLLGDLKKKFNRLTISKLI